LLFGLVIRKEGAELLCLIGFLVIAGVVANYYNIKTWKMFVGSIGGYAQVAAGNLESGVATYKQYLTGRPMERDARVTLINLAVSNQTALSSLSEQKSQEILDYVISLAELNAASNPYDSLMQMQLAQILDLASRQNYRNLEKFNFYSSQAMNAIENSIEASPERATTYFVKAQMQIVRMENDAAVETMKKAIALNPNYFEGHCRLAQILFIVNDKKYDNEIGPALNNCLDKGGSEQLTSTNLLKLAINYYSEKKDYARAATLSERLASISTPDPEVWYNLAKLHYVIGNTTKAEEDFQKALALNASLITDWGDFKKLIDGNRKVTQ